MKLFCKKVDWIFSIVWAYCEVLAAMGEQIESWWKLLAQSVENVSSQVSATVAVDISVATKILVFEF